MAIRKDDPPTYSPTTMPTVGRPRPRPVATEAAGPVARPARTPVAQQVGRVSPENAGVTLRPKARPLGASAAGPKARPQTALGSGGTRAGLASDENAGRRAAAAAAPATARARTTKETTSASKPSKSKSVDPATFARPVGPIGGGETRGQRQQRMALERMHRENRRTR